RPARPQTGDELLLVGSPFGLGGTVTTGVVSRVGPRWVQTDAAANPGNSGGPAIDRNGRVVGVMLAIVRGGQNIGFAVRIERGSAAQWPVPASARAAIRFAARTHAVGSQACSRPYAKPAAKASPAPISSRTSTCLGGGMRSPRTIAPSAPMRMTESQGIARAS